MFCGKPNLCLGRFPPPLDQEKRHRKRHSPGYHTSANSNRCFSVNFAPLVTARFDSGASRGCSAAQMGFNEVAAAASGS
jgi:hypothetical protein